MFDVSVGTNRWLRQGSMPPRCHPIGTHRWRQLAAQLAATCALQRSTPLHETQRSRRHLRSAPAPNNGASKLPAGRQRGSRNLNVAGQASVPPSHRILSTATTPLVFFRSTCTQVAALMRCMRHPRRQEFVTVVAEATDNFTRPCTTRTLELSHAYSTVCFRRTYLLTYIHTLTRSAPPRSCQLCWFPCAFFVQRKLVTTEYHVQHVPLAPPYMSAFDG
jgi:hypothetical protein